MRAHRMACLRLVGVPGHETWAITHHSNGVIGDELDGGAQLYESEVNESAMSVRANNARVGVPCALSAFRASAKVA